MEMIRVKDMVKVMSNDEPFSITFVTCNLKDGTGGEKITLDEAICVGGPSTRVTAKNPNHGQNFTRNIRALHGDRFTKIHALLVTRFNGMRVTL